MATIRDVAKESGVSVATVSYVLNDGPRPVHPDTRQRVLATIRRLDYHPNAMARGLVRRRMNTLGVLSGFVSPGLVTDQAASNILQGYGAAVLEGVLDGAAALGYNVTLFTERWQNTEISASFRDRRTDGVIVVAPPADSDVIVRLAALGLPFVVVSSPVERPDVPWVDVDNEKGVQQAVRHLVSQGHIRIAHILGDPDIVCSGQRRDTFRALLGAAGIPVRDEYLVQTYSVQRAQEQNRDSVRRLLQLPDRPTAVFAFDDGLALLVLETARELGIRVPEQLSVVGFNDIALASQVTPLLTTVRQPLARIGEQAARLLVARVEAQPIAMMAHVFEPELIVRGSTAPPPSP